jgi:hypothetical protein
MSEPNRFRETYRELRRFEEDYIFPIKLFASDLAEAIEATPAGREQSLAITKLEEAVMWAVKGVTK